MEWLVIFSSIVGIALGATMKGAWERRGAKKAPKTEMRAEAYSDFIVYVVRTANTSSAPVAHRAGTEDDFHRLCARLLLFGESTVVNAVSRLLKHESLGSVEAQGALMDVVKEMRKSLLTGHGDLVMESAKTLANAKPWVA